MFFGGVDAAFENEEALIEIFQNQIKHHENGFDKIFVPALAAQKLGAKRGHRGEYRVKRRHFEHRDRHVCADLKVNLRLKVKFQITDKISEMRFESQVSLCSLSQ